MLSVASSASSTSYWVGAWDVDIGPYCSGGVCYASPGSTTPLYFGLLSYQDPAVPPPPTAGASVNTSSPLTARVLIIADTDGYSRQIPGHRIALVALDVVGIDMTKVDELRWRIASRTGLLPEEILVNASHTHSAPMSKIWKT